MISQCSCCHCSIGVYRNDKWPIFVVCESEYDVFNVECDNEKLKELLPLNVVVTCQAESDAYNHYDFISRYFWSNNGGGEDPRTGSVHTGLAPLWAERLGKKNPSLIKHHVAAVF